MKERFRAFPQLLPILVSVASTHFTPAVAEDKSCGLKTLTAIEYQLELPQIEDKKFYPDLLAVHDGMLVEGRRFRTPREKHEHESQGKRGPPQRDVFYTGGEVFRRKCKLSEEVRDSRLSGDRIELITSSGHIQSYFRDVFKGTSYEKADEERDSGVPKCAPLTDQKVEGVTLKQVLKDQIIGELPDGSPAVLDKEGKAITALPASLRGAIFLPEPTPQNSFHIAYRDDRFWVFSAQWKIVHSVRMDRSRVVLTSGMGWIAAYSGELQNMIVYGLNGERISNIDLPKKRWKISLTPGGGPILAENRTDGTLLAFDPKTGIAIGSAKVDPNLGPPASSDRYYFLDGHSVQLSVLPTNKKITRLVNIPCNEELTEEPPSQTPNSQTVEGK